MMLRNCCATQLFSDLVKVVAKLDSVTRPKTYRRPTITSIIVFNLHFYPAFTFLRFHIDILVIEFITHKCVYIRTRTLLQLLSLSSTRCVFISQIIDHHNNMIKFCAQYHNDDLDMNAHRKNRFFVFYHGGEARMSAFDIIIIVVFGISGW